MTPNYLLLCFALLFSEYFKHFSAEREGFEPPEALTSTVFKTAAIDHSAISPVVLNMFCGERDSNPWKFTLQWFSDSLRRLSKHALFLKSDCKGKTIFQNKKETLENYFHSASFFIESEN